MSDKKSPLGRKSKLLSVYRVGLAISIEMVGPVWQCCHFACLGGLLPPTLCANGAAAVISPCFFQIYSEFFRGSRAARPSRCLSICHNTNVLLCETERERERETAGRRFMHFSHGLKKQLYSTPLEH